MESMLAEIPQQDGHPSGELVVLLGPIVSVTRRASVWAISVLDCIEVWSRLAEPQLGDPDSDVARQDNGLQTHPGFVHAGQPACVVSVRGREDFQHHQIRRSIMQPSQDVPQPVHEKVE